MRRRECFVLLVGAMIFAALMVVSPAAQQSPAQTWCYGNDSTDDQTIAGCTRVIQSGRENQRDLASAYFYRGVAYGHKGDFDHAIRDFDQVIKINPTYQAFYSRGLTYSNQGLWDRAIQDYDEAIKLEPNEAIPVNNVAMLTTKSAKLTAPFKISTWRSSLIRTIPMPSTIAASPT